MIQGRKCECWEDEDAWLGHFSDFPDFATQGESLDDLRAHLEDLFVDLTELGLAGTRDAYPLVERVDRSFPSK